MTKLEKLRERIIRADPKDKTEIPLIILGILEHLVDQERAVEFDHPKTKPPRITPIPEMVEAVLGNKWRPQVGESWAQVVIRARDAEVIAWLEHARGEHELRCVCVYCQLSRQLIQALEKA